MASDANNGRRNGGDGPGGPRARMVEVTPILVGNPARVGIPIGGRVDAPNGVQRKARDMDEHQPLLELALRNPLEDGYADYIDETAAFGRLAKQVVMLGNTTAVVALDGRVHSMESLMIEQASMDAAGHPPPQPGGNHEHTAPYIWGWGARPSGMRGRLKLIEADSAPVKQEDDAGKMIYQRIVRAHGSLDHYGLALEDGPYAAMQTAEGLQAMEDIARACQGKDLFETMERIMDTFRFGIKAPNIPGYPWFELEYHLMAEQLPHIIEPEFRFVLDGDLVPPVNARPTVGNVYVGDRFDQGEIVGGEQIGTSQFRVDDPIQPYLFAVAVLRRLGYEAFPVATIIPNHTGHLVLGVVDMKGKNAATPLTTFDLYRYHPPTQALLLLSDFAVEAIVNAIHAMWHVKQLCAEMCERAATKGKALEESEVQAQIDRFARRAFISRALWNVDVDQLNGNRYVQIAFQTLYVELISAVMKISPIEGSKLTNIVEPTTKRRINNAEYFAYGWVGKAQEAYGKLVSEALRQQAQSNP